MGIQPSISFFYVLVDLSLKKDEVRASEVNHIEGL